MLHRHATRWVPNLARFSTSSKKTMLSGEDGIVLALKGNLIAEQYASIGNDDKGLLLKLLHTRLDPLGLGFSAIITGGSSSSNNNIGGGGGGGCGELSNTYLTKGLEPCLEVLEQEILRNPTEITNIWLAQTGYKILGTETARMQRFNSLKRIKQEWKGVEQKIAYLYGLNSSCEVENGMMDMGRESAGRSLSLAGRVGRLLVEEGPSCDAIFAMLSLYELENKNREGLRFLRETRQFWEGMSVAPSIDLFRSLFTLDIGSVSQSSRNWMIAAFDEHENKPKSVSFIGDSAAVLWRIKVLEQEDVDSNSNNGFNIRQFFPLSLSKLKNKTNSKQNNASITTMEERFRILFEAARKNQPEFLPSMSALHALHWAILLAGAQRLDLFKDLYSAIDMKADSDTPSNSTDFPSTRINSLSTVSDHELRFRVVRCIHFYALEKFDHCLNEILLIRNHLNRLGGTHSQRDILPFMLVYVAAKVGGVDLKSEDLITSELVKNKPALTLAKYLVDERLEDRAQSPQLWLLRSKILATKRDSFEEAKSALSRAMDLGYNQGGKDTH